MRSRGDETPRPVALAGPGEAAPDAEALAALARVVGATPADGRVDWARVRAGHALFGALAGVPQDPVHHAEGDVDVHTRLVLEALVGDPAWQALAPGARATTFATAALHDVGKPDCLKVDEDGRITARGHARRGAMLARVALWRAGLSAPAREPIVALVRGHMLPFFLVERPDAARIAHGLSHTARCDQLEVVARADARGRTCADPGRLEDAVAMFGELCAADRCLDGPYPFADATTRFEYFRAPGRDPTWAAHDATTFEVIVLAGLPGSGKDRWVARNAPDLPVVSLDAVRRARGVDPGDDQGAVVEEARELARVHLRAGRPFVWNATNLSRAVRGAAVGLCAGYGARVRLVHVEVPWPVLRRQNRERSHPVPEPVIERLLERWEVPDASEAHAVEWVT